MAEPYPDSDPVRQMAAGVQQTPMPGGGEQFSAPGGTATATPAPEGPALGTPEQAATMRGTGEYTYAGDPWSIAGANVYRAAMAHLTAAGNDPYKQQQSMAEWNDKIAKFEGAKAAARKEQGEYLKLQKAQQEADYADRSLATAPTEREKFERQYTLPGMGGGKVPPNLAIHGGGGKPPTWILSGKEPPPGSQVFEAAKKMFGGDALQAQQFIDSQKAAITRETNRQSQLARMQGLFGAKNLPVYNTVMTAQAGLQQLIEMGHEDMWPGGDYRERVAAVASALSRIPGFPAQKEIVAAVASYRANPAAQLRFVESLSQQLSDRATMIASQLPPEWKPGDQPAGGQERTRKHPTTGRSQHWVE